MTSYISESDADQFVSRRCNQLYSPVAGFFFFGRERVVQVGTVVDFTTPRRTERSREREGRVQLVVA